MDISQSILQSNSPTTSTYNSSSSLLSSSSSSAFSSSSGGLLDGIKSINVTTWILIILILAFLGLNIFVYLAKGTQTVADIFAPITAKIFGETTTVLGQTVDVSAEGAKAVVGGTSDVVQGGLTAVQQATPNGPIAKTSIQLNPHPIAQNPSQGDQMSLHKAINTAQSQDIDYQAHEASSSLQSGWCYIGDDRGYRTCSEVGPNDTCMSGDIFPSREICMNPNLRA